MRRRSMPRPLGPWALDSGGFSELSLYGGWRTGAAQYAEEVQRWSSRMPGLEWAAVQDWMCEPHIRSLTGLSVREHQDRTVRSYLELRELAPELPWAPILQGWEVRDYLEHIELWQAAGVDLSAAPVVGVGSVCRRSHTWEVESILGTLSGFGFRLHGFGVKILGLQRAARFLASADSMAWSAHARRRPALPGCPHRTCSSCLRYALRWRERVLKSIEEAPRSLFDLTA